MKSGDLLLIKDCSDFLFTRESYCRVINVNCGQILLAVPKSYGISWNDYFINGKERKTYVNISAQLQFDSYYVNDNTLRDAV